MDIMLWTCAGIALGSAVLALAFLPRRAAPPARPDQVTEATRGAPAGTMGT
jgi:hypothetical protein